MEEQHHDEGHAKIHHGPLGGGGGDGDSSGSPPEEGGFLVFECSCPERQLFYVIVGARIHGSRATLSQPPSNADGSQRRNGLSQERTALWSVSNLLSLIEHSLSLSHRSREKINNSNKSSYVRPCCVKALGSTAPK